MSFDLLIPFLRPIEPLLLDDDVSEIMGNPNATWYAEREGQMLPQPEITFDPGSLRTGLEVIANNLGKRLDEDNPVLEAQLPDGSRICAYIPPAVKPRPGLTIRKFTGRHFAADDLIARGTLSRRLADYLADQIRSGKTLLISGGTGTGKTTLLNVLAQSIPDEERIVTIEDTAELRIPKPNLVSFECQTDTFKEPLSFEKLLRTALRCRPDRIIVGEVRGTEARTLLDSLNTGHSGSLATIHANSAAKAMGPRERVRTIARMYAESPVNTLIVSPDNASRRELNNAVRSELRTSGMLSNEEHAITVLVQRQDMTGADRAWANHYEPDDIVRYSRGSKASGIEAGSYAKVATVDASQNLLTVQRDSDGFVTYDAQRLAGVSVFRETARDFSVGDRIQFTAPDKSLGVANRDLATIESIAPEGNITARLDDNRRVEFNAAEHRHFDHGYAVTSHSAQGLTAERVLIHADTSVHPDLLSSRFGYVAVSRASHEAAIFTDDVTKLAQQLGTAVTKTSALETTHSVFVGQGLEMG